MSFFRDFDEYISTWIARICGFVLFMVLLALSTCDEVDEVRHERLREHESTDRVG